jgi:two-component system CheB/CheR fusion protein
MARGGLLYPLRSALNGARRKRRAYRKENILIQKNGEWRAINLEVLPLVTSRGEYFLILFERPSGAAGAKGRKATTTERREARGQAVDARLTDLRRELAASREYLQSIIQELEAANEELQSANEEILSSNEELQSTNEELDTAKEELQSTNEELNTVNEELHSRNEELARVNSDLMNLLGSVDLPIVIVGEDMAIRRFTPAAERLFNLISGDVGRPIGQINPNIICDNLEGLIRTTIEGVHPQEQDVKDRDGHGYSLRIRPYKNVDNRLDGAVLTAIRVDESRQLPADGRRSPEYITGMVDLIEQPMLLLDTSLRIRSANDAFCEAMGTTRQRIEGTLLYDLPDGQWNVPEVRSIASAASDGKDTRRIRINRDGGRKQIELKVRAVQLDDASKWIVVAMEPR